LSKARKKITPEAYQLLSCHLVQDFYADDDVLLWRGQWRVLATDGSTVQLPSSSECIAAFGVSGGVRCTPLVGQQNRDLSIIFSLLHQ
jgi:hypothetical protein